MFDDFDPPLAPGVAAKAGAVLAALADDRRGIDDIASATGLTASTVLRVAALLQNRGRVVVTETEGALWLSGGVSDRRRR
ncbi:helix-turn-helix domain-containing protein [Sphingopyxis terrae]|uniref:helix-turn-helix domain-containing protein n=1 Tax=Sphingopyxis terrae TaxID=33052 RepID=UPI000786A606|nr:helix-turn-helix domain-containing protein [Sphingopyxis terrae]